MGSGAAIRSVSETGRMLLLTLHRFTGKPKPPREAGEMLGSGLDLNYPSRNETDILVGLGLL